MTSVAVFLLWSIFTWLIGMWVWLIVRVWIDAPEKENPELNMELRRHLDDLNERHVQAARDQQGDAGSEEEVSKPHEAIVAQLPPRAMLAIGRVRAFGIAKYPTDHWAALPVATHLNGAVRHVFRFMGGELVDPESGEHPLAHAALRVLMALDILLAKGAQK